MSTPVLESSNKSKNLPSNWVDFASRCKIRSGQGIVNFIPYEYQKNLINAINERSTTVIAKTRQLGITECISNYFLFKAYHNEGYLGVIFSKCQSDTSNIAKRLRRQIDSLELETKTDSLTDIELCDGGRILFRNSTPNGARGLESVSDILYDEAAFVEDIEEIYKSSIPCTTVVGEKAKIIINSTPNGQSGWFWDKLNNNNTDVNLLDMCSDIKTQSIEGYQHWIDNNGWNKVLIHWLAHPVYSQNKNVYLRQIQNKFELPEEVVEQEYNLSFTHSEEVIFSNELIKACCSSQWNRKDKEGVFYMGLDTSSFGADYTVLTILKHSPSDGTLRYVNNYRERKANHQHHLYKIGELIEEYEPINLIVEVNSSGRTYYEKLVEDFPQFNISAFNTTQQSKVTLINNLLVAMENGKLICPKDKYLIDEFLSFRKKPDSNQVGAITGKHDDLVMSLAFAVFGAGRLD